MREVYQDGYVVGAGVDYIAASSPVGRRGRALHRAGEACVADAISRGDRERPFAAHGYAGVAAGGAAVGAGDGGTIVRLSGHRTATYVGEILRQADHVSRIDLQTTVRFNRDVAALARRHCSELQAKQRQLVRRVHTRLERTFGRGDTLYVGSRASQWFGRIYDKFRESKDEEYRRCWRYEVECKDDAAQKAARFVEQSDNSSADIGAAVSGWFRARGITPRYQPTMAGSMGPVSTTDTDAARSLRWLGRDVRPVVARLSLVYGRDVVLAVLLGELDPSTVLPIQPEPEEELAAYDEWTIARAEEVD